MMICDQYVNGLYTGTCQLKVSNVHDIRDAKGLKPVLHLAT